MEGKACKNWGLSTSWSSLLELVINREAVCSVLYAISVVNENKTYTPACVRTSSRCGSAEVISTGMARPCADRMRNRALLSELDKYLHLPYEGIHRGQHKDQNQQYISINN